MVSDYSGWTAEGCEYAECPDCSAHLPYDGDVDLMLDAIDAHVCPEGMVDNTT